MNSRWKGVKNIKYDATHDNNKTSDTYQDQEASRAASCRAGGDGGRAHRGAACLVGDRPSCAPGPLPEPRWPAALTQEAYLAATNLNCYTLSIISIGPKHDECVHFGLYSNQYILMKHACFQSNSALSFSAINHTWLLPGGKKFGGGPEVAGGGPCVGGGPDMGGGPVGLWGKAEVGLTTGWGALCGCCGGGAALWASPRLSVLARPAHSHTIFCYLI